LNLLLLEPEEVDAEGIAVLSDARARHLQTILRAAPNQAVRIGVLDGPIGVGRLLAIGNGVANLACTFEHTPPRPRIDLLLALPRPKVLRRLWAQIAALGVNRVILTNAARVERNYFDTHVLEPAVYRPLLIEGLQQARDTRVPLVTVHRQFRVLIEDELDSLAGDGRRLVAEPGRGESIASATMTIGSTRLLLAVGPEGGWNEFELQLMRAHRFIGVSMGPRTLRSDTACVALLALANDALKGAT
jgi:16S rRNA (uracil1498-N3)-methyltransferase